MKFMWFVPLLGVQQSFIKNLILFRSIVDSREDHGRELTVCYRKIPLTAWWLHGDKKGAMLSLQHLADAYELGFCQ